MTDLLFKPKHVFVQGQKLKCISNDATHHYKDRIYTFALYLYDNPICGMYTVEGPNHWSGCDGKYFIPATAEEIALDFNIKLDKLQKDTALALELTK